MRTLFKNDREGSLPWNNIYSVEDLDLLLMSPSPKLFFKHSTRCGFSRMALNTFEKEWGLTEKECQLYYIDLLKYRDVSNRLAERANVIHESPQVIVLSEKEVIYNASHSNIDAKAIEEKIHDK